ncbi:MAG: host-nuclease inhibitor Gam family protein [Firmicutes bacterium]|nr:host-nuclease inhibitor Gam family protein [Bacillota bacterium]
MARQRFAAPSLKSWEEVDMNLKDICEIELQVEALEAELTQKISDLRLEKEMQAKPLLERKEKLGLEIKDFVERHLDELNGRSRVLNFGTVGLRRTTSILLRNVKAVLEALKARGMKDCIITKESVSKDALKEYPDEVLASIGVRRKTEDVIWYETDRARLQE